MLSHDMKRKFFARSSVILSMPVRQNEKAIHQLLNECCGYRHAEKIYHIPKSMLHYRVHRRRRPVLVHTRRALNNRE